jgi:hypothetical protein
MMNILKDGSRGIKLVWPGWFEDEFATERIGFPRDYDKRFEIPVNSEMLIYVTEYKYILAINKVTGTWDDGKKKYSPSGNFPICLPIKETYKSEYGLSLKEIQLVVPNYKPHEGLSFFPLDDDSFNKLKKRLLEKG